MCDPMKLSGFWGHKPSHPPGAVIGQKTLSSRDSLECGFKDPGNSASCPSLQTRMSTLCLGFAFETLFLSSGMGLFSSDFLLL